MTRSRRVTSLACAVLLGHIGFAAAAAAIVEQPRPFGHVIGDVVTQRVLLSSGDSEFTPAELPAPGRVGVWFERRRATVELDARGRRWLVVTYQLMNSPQTLTLIRLPGWKLKSRDANTELSVPEWAMSVGPLTPAEPFAQAGLGALRPDRAPIPIALAPLQRGLTIGVAGALLSVLLWIGWWMWRGWRESQTLPFATACREIEKEDAAAPETWRALHRAFDRTAGRAIRTETLPLLFEHAPQLQPLRPVIERFFTQSAARFYGGQVPHEAVSAHELCRDLRRIEKRYAS